MLVLGLGDDDVRSSASMRDGRGAEVPRAAEVRTEIFVAEVTSVLAVAKGARSCVLHLPLWAAEEMLHLRML